MSGRQIKKLRRVWRANAFVKHPRDPMGKMLPVPGAPSWRRAKKLAAEARRMGPQRR